MDSKEIMSFRAKVNKNSTVTLTEVVKAEGTVEKISIRFYQGQQLALQVQPFIVMTGRIMYPLVNYADNSDQFLSGDNDYFQYDLVLPCGLGDIITIIVTNTDTVNDYNCSIDVAVDYYGGRSRIIGGAVNG